MNINWKDFGNEVLKQCTKDLDPDSMAYQIFQVSTITSTTAIRKYHEMLMKSLGKDTSSPE